jgi:hypothetical protein
MKTKAVIIAFLIVSLICAFAFTSHAQCATDTSKTLLADETWLTYTKTGAKIVSYSEQAFKDIALKFGERFKSIAIKYKTDRNGPYKEYAIYLSQDVANNIRNWAKTNL